MPLSHPARPARDGLGPRRVLGPGSGAPFPAASRQLLRLASSRLRALPGVPAGSTNTQLCNFPTRRQTDPDEPYNPHATTARLC
jgi:hypothetical protein